MYTSSPSTFPLFARLPPELRIQIWNTALPLPTENPPQPALFPYKKGCWQPIWLPADDSTGYPNIHMQFQHSHLSPIQVKLPALACVNQEARHITLTWARRSSNQQDTIIEEQHSNNKNRNGQYTAFTRRFYSALDALYIPPDRLEAFMDEPFSRLEAPDLAQYGASFSYVSIKHLALPAEVLWQESAINPLGEAFDAIAGFEVLYILANGPLPGFRVHDSMKIQPYWELGTPRECCRGRAFVWNREWREFSWEEKEDGGCSMVIDEALYQQIELASEGLVDQLVWHAADSFQIRPVFAVRR